MASNGNHASESLIYDVRLSSVVPAQITAEEKVRHELRNIDLAMKLHGVRAVYFFGSDAAEGLTISDLKNPMFRWLELYYPVCGRIRVDGDGGDGAAGRPYVRCNDSGVRIVEAKCAKSLEEWLEMVRDEESSSINDQLVYRQVLGHDDLGFSPLVFLQFTKFKCGGLCVGLSWAHILGDVFSASDFINTWGQILAGHVPSADQFLDFPAVKSPSLLHASSLTNQPLSLRRLPDPVGDNWLIPTHTSTLQTHTFELTPNKVNELRSKIVPPGVAKTQVMPFHLISAVLWKCLAKIRGSGSEPKIVTVCSKGSYDNNRDRENGLRGTGLSIGVVQTSFTIGDADLFELAKMVAEKTLDETDVIEDYVGEGNVTADFIVYGGNLTLVNMEEADVYGLEVKGEKPIFANFTIGGVGDEGAVMVLPSSPANLGGRTVNLILPEYQLVKLKHDLRANWGMF